MRYLVDDHRHLICVPYSVENLHAMAEDLGIERCWFHGGKYPHYDVPKRRVHEIICKASVVDRRKIYETIILGLQKGLYDALHSRG